MDFTTISIKVSGNINLKTKKKRRLYKKGLRFFELLKVENYHI